MKQKTQIGVVGLGNMGLGMALSLQRSGFDVLGLDRDPEAMRRAQSEGVPTCENMSILAAGCDAIVLSLPTSCIVKAALTGEDGIFVHAKSGLKIIDTTTGDPSATRELSILASKRGITLVEAPVSGGPTGARKGALTMFLGGTKDDISAVQPVLEALGDKLFHIGGVGAGGIAKIVNNLLTAAHLLTASEAFRMAEAAGVSTEQLIEAVNAGSGRSGVTLFNYPKRILTGSFDSGFSMQLMRKDVALAATLSERLNVTIPVIKEVMDVWKESSCALSDQDDFNRIVGFERPEGAAA